MKFHIHCDDGHLNISGTLVQLMMGTQYILECIGKEIGFDRVMELLVKPNFAEKGYSIHFDADYIDGETVKGIFTAMGTTEQLILACSYIVAYTSKQMPFGIKEYFEILKSTHKEIPGKLRES